MNDLFAKLAAQEEAFFSSDFLSPVLRGRPIRVRIANVDLSLKVHPKNFQGWGIFRSKDQKMARFVSEPSMVQKRQYLDLYPRISLVVCRQDDPRGIPASQSDERFAIKGQVPICLPEEVRVFDTVDVRFDGVNMWHDGASSHRSPRVANALRECLLEDKEPDSFALYGMSAEEKIAYHIAYIHKIEMDIESKRDRKEERLKGSLERAGAMMRSYMERGDTYTVEFSVGGEVHRSVVDSETLRVQSAGICLNGGDQEFDLQSLVSVIREGQNRDLIYRVGINNR